MSLTTAGILIGASLAANAAESLIVSLNSIPDRVRKQNPDLAAARYRITEAIGKLNQSGKRSNPKLSIGTTHNTRLREHSLTVGISRKFPLTNRLALEKAVSYTRVKAAEAEIREVERQLITQARQLAVKILATREQRKLLRQQAQIARELANSIGTAADKGERSAIDAGQAKLEAAQFTNAIRQLDAAEISLTGELKPILGMLASESLAIHGNLTKHSHPVRSTNTGNRPDLHAAKLHAKAAGQAAELERAKRRDDIELSVTAGIERTEDAPDGLENEGINRHRATHTPASVG